MHISYIAITNSADYLVGKEMTLVLHMLWQNGKSEGLVKREELISNRYAEITFTKLMC